MTDTPADAPARARSWRGWAASALVVGLALRAHHIAAQSLWSDEDITLDRALTPLADMLRGLPVEQAPWYYLLMRPWTLAAGSSDLALRWPSLLAGALAIPLAYALGRRLAGRSAGRVLAWIAAINPFLVYHGQEARAYSLLFTLSLAAPLAVLRAEETGRKRWWVGAGSLAAGAVLTHHFGALLVAALAGWAWIDLRSGGPVRPRGWLLAAATAALLYLPALPHALGVLGHEGWREGWPLVAAPRDNLLAWSAGMQAGGSTALAGTRWAVGGAAGLYLLLAILGVRELWRRARGGGRSASRARMALLLGLLPVALWALLLAAISRPAAGNGQRLADYDPRYFMAGLAGAYLLASAGAARLRGAVPLLVTVALLPLDHHYRDWEAAKPDYRRLLARVAAEARDPTVDRVPYASTHDEDTVLLLDGPSDGLARRYRAEGMPVKIVRLSGRAEDPAVTGELLADLAPEYAELWLAEDGGAAGVARAWLMEHAYWVSEEPFQTWRLSRFLIPGDRALAPASEAPDPSGPGSGGAEGRHLIEGSGGGWAVALRPPVRATAGERLPLELWSRCVGPDGCQGELRLSVRLEGGPDGRRALLALDGELRRGLAGPRHDASHLDRWAPDVPADITPGEHGLRLEAYRMEGDQPHSLFSVDLPLRVEPALRARPDQAGP